MARFRDLEAARVIMMHSIYNHVAFNVILLVYGSN